MLKFIECEDVTHGQTFADPIYSDDEVTLVPLEQLRAVLDLVRVFADTVEVKGPLRWQVVADDAVGHPNLLIDQYVPDPKNIVDQPWASGTE